MDDTTQCQQSKATREQLCDEYTSASVSVSSSVNLDPGPSKPDVSQTDLEQCYQATQQTNDKVLHFYNNNNIYAPYGL